MIRLLGHRVGASRIAFTELRIRARRTALTLPPQSGQSAREFTPGCPLWSNAATPRRRHRATERGSHRRAADDCCEALPLARVRCAAGFGVTVSDAWAFFSALMPESDDVKVRPLHTVVHEIPHAGKVETTNVLVSGVLDRCADAGLLDQSFERSLDAFANCAWRSGSIFAPPCGCAVDLPLCARLDAYDERQTQPYLLRRSSSFSAETPASRSASSSASSNSD